jgi:hypothetical protein
MARLPQGSLVLFGTRYRDDRGYAFHLDTVFVVRDFVSYNTSRLTDLVPVSESEKLYQDLSLKITYPVNGAIHADLRLYRGAAFTKSYEGMYSFSPARVYDPSNPGAASFSPVIINAPPYINPGQTTGFNAQNGRTDFEIAEVRKLWKDIRAQCRRAKCVEGVFFDIPKGRRNTR